MSGNIGFPAQTRRALKREEGDERERTADANRRTIPCIRERATEYTRKRYYFADISRTRLDQTGLSSIEVCLCFSFSLSLSLSLSLLLLSFCLREKYHWYLYSMIRKINS